eukprot:13503333-Ditylum_brightwellii.AAC.1
MTPEEKKIEEVLKAAQEKERREYEELKEKEEEEHRKKWDPKSNFKSNILKPSDNNTNPDGNKQTGYTVWSSDGYGNDGWHRYNGPPDKEFNSTYATIEDANARARYLFYWKNPWGQGADELMEEGQGVNESVDKNGLKTYDVTPDDSTTWTFGVVPNIAFVYLENATIRRNNDDGNFVMF